MPTKDSPYYSREFKLSAVRRMVEGVNVSALSRELQVKRNGFTHGLPASGPVALKRFGHAAGRPRPSIRLGVRSRKPSGSRSRRRLRQ
jgi:hypothetical protein